MDPLEADQIQTAMTSGTLFPLPGAAFWAPGSLDADIPTG